MAEVLVSNLLHDNLPQREHIEGTVREVLRAQEGTWVVTLTSDKKLPENRVSVRVRQPDGELAVTTVAVDASRQDIVDQLNALIG